MSGLPPCPACGSDLTYEDGAMLVCPECAHEWAPGDATGGGETRVHRDAVGNILADGDSVTVIKDLKVKGAGSALKAGTKVRNIRLVDEDHDIDCRIDGFGPMKLKSEFVRKA
ncbi:zinc ribbon domain-containing protein YjdM [Luteimonas sp. 8-5]|uniref:zinc ribbon domain-containing protein YjdM n=1 Tax=Luteimonas sp. 8-5 TaxID=3039387 RepID=UPI0024371257|nr:zinc ribbon domain-containing protein YjdM [Luteimonas sp. 8-5]MDG6348917.1 zinc ribbon domain-containing protein YjdM [Luteimonas sp. 8-5]